MTDSIDTAEHNPVGSIRMFRNECGTSMFPDGLVKILDQNCAEPGDYRVTYVAPPDGLDGRAFHALGRELIRPTITQPVIDIDAWWVVVLPGVPTFYLNGTVQGIMTKLDAARIASQIVTNQSVGPSNIEKLSEILS